MAPVRKINPEYLRRVARASDVAALKQLAYQRLSLQEGDHVVDIGCGPAIDTLAIARIVGQRGSVLGIDVDQVMVDEANRAAVEAGVGTVVRHILADAKKLPVQSGSAAACFCERVLQHIPFEQCQGVVNEMLRVIKPGGRLVIIDTDWATLSIGTANPLLERALVAEHQKGFANPYSGRYLLSLLRNAAQPVEDVAIQPMAIRLPYESVRFLMTDTVGRGVMTGRLTFPNTQQFISEVDGAQNYRILQAHLTLVLASATKGTQE